MKVYVVEHGAYSDRCVVGVYSTEERARIAASLDGDITEYELDAALDLYDKGFRPFFVEMLHDGTVIKTSNLGYWSGMKPQCSMSSTDKWCAGTKTRWNCTHVLTWAKDEQHAIKIANEHRAELVAAGWNGIDHFTDTMLPASST